MKLRGKTLLTVGAVLTVMTILIVIIASSTLASEALDLERKKVQDDTRVALNAMNNMEAALQNVLRDYSYWDDTYSFMQGSEPGYTDANFVNLTFMNLKLNYILLFDNDQNLVFGKGYDYEGDQDIDVSDSLVALLRAENVPPYLNDSDDGQVGIASLEEGLAIVALNPISDSAASAPSIGTMVMARLLSQQQIEDFSSSLINEVNIVGADQAGWNGLTDRVRTSVLTSATISVVPVNDTAVEGYVRLTSFAGESVAILSIREARDIYQEANNSVIVLMSSMLLVSLVFGALTLLITDRLFMRRVIKLSEQVGDIGLNGDVSRRVMIDGSDELSDLAKETNKTLDALETLELELRGSEKRYRAIVNDQSEMIFRAHEDGTVTFVNDAMTKELHMAPDVVVGKDFSDLLPTAIAGQLVDHVNEVKRSGKAITREYHLRTKAGEFKLYSWTIREISDQDRDFKEYQGVGRDLTEQRLAEQAVQQANKKLSLLASITRHDVMNQLTVAHGFVVIAKLQAGDRKVEEQLAKAEQAIQMIHGYLEFTRDYQRMGMVQPVWIDLRKAIEKAAETPRSNGIKVTTDVGDYEVSCDPLVEKVFYNLMDNSLRHGGKVGEIRISAQAQDDGLLLLFEDDGLGVEEKVKEQIFDAGYGSNTGYGLFLAREILSASSMTIKEAGVYGKGARFEIFVPKERYRQRP